MEPGGFTPCTAELRGSNLPGGCASQQSVTRAATKARCVDIGLDMISRKIKQEILQEVLFWKGGFLLQEFLGRIVQL